ncbi:UDP-N-acetylmuramate dehydrogenase [Paratractidigestivibacter sp.]|uniref:UDP-N-acetylmuramate dehydrogenase n=1 Tax=Paratractidigestivibacter sp. TaxID=2847316 RepID=UPI002ABE1AF6|nr:UDP-N-acetylmuramate dehydrogenase [Paratractidigestivibacter sp.]
MSLFNAYMSLSGAGDADVLRDEKLSRRTSYRIGGPASLLILVHSYAVLGKVVDVLASENVEWVILGKGSNILAADTGFEGAVIILDDEFARVSIDVEEGIICAGAGALLSRVVSDAAKAELSGLEFCVGIPGTVGGAVSMDAGTRREWIGQRVRDLVVYRPGEGLHRYEAQEIDWGYRCTSIPTSEIILEATLKLEHGEKAAISAHMEERLARRRCTQPMGKPTCGSVFRNPPDGSAGSLIEAAGCKGLSSGRAQVSLDHANFIVNNGGASASDVISLIHLIHDSVLANHGVDLKCEVKLLGFGD